MSTHDHTPGSTPDPTREALLLGLADDIAARITHLQALLVMLSHRADDEGDIVRSALSGLAELAQATLADIGGLKGLLQQEIDEGTQSC